MIPIRVFLALCSIKCDEIHTCLRWYQGACHPISSLVSLVSCGSLGECLTKRSDRRDAIFCVEWVFDFEYFDGSSTIQERERAIERFQNDPKCRVFLISLKAGGVGLNLTAADYVYIVDPWWNPAVEQQAIDRTHRIGQTKNIFAYRMICNDTVEDKILKLQDRKRALAKDLISDEEGFVKSLTKEDINYLFS